MKNNQTKILVYHSLASRKRDGYCVTFDEFKKQVALIKEEAASCAITFDDGDISNYSIAYPTLIELERKAYFFVIVSKIGTEGYMTWDQLKEIDRNGMIIGSHGMTHAILTELNNNELEYEILTSKRDIEYKLGHKIEYFSIPKGYYDNKVLNELKKADYKAVFTSNPNDVDEFKLGRIAVRSDWNIEYFRKVINNRLSIGHMLANIIKALMKMAMGPRKYDNLRNKLVRNQ